jgi:hypothetical protein
MDVKAITEQAKSKAQEKQDGRGLRLEHGPV